MFSTVLYIALQCKPVLFSASRCSTVLLCALQCFTVLYSASLCSSVLHCALQCFTVLYSASLCFTVLHCALQCSIALYSLLLRVSWKVWLKSASQVRMLCQATKKPCRQSKRGWQSCPPTILSKNSQLQKNLEKLSWTCHTWCTSPISPGLNV